MEDFKTFIEEKRAWYQSIGKVFCPILNEWVVFNAKGFRHLRYDGKGKVRTNKEQARRMNTLPNAMEIIREATDIFDYQVRYSKSEKKQVQYWELGKAIENHQVTVILRKVGAGQVSFYSIWKKKKKSKNPPEGEIL